MRNGTAVVHNNCLVLVNAEYAPLPSYAYFVERWTVLMYIL
jgi:hypothetical protein